MNLLFHGVLLGFIAASIVLLGVSPEVVHEHGHHEGICAETHEANSVDTCHLRLFHDGNASACEDHHHLMDNSDECAFCQLTVPNYPVLKFVDKAEHKTADKTSIQFDKPIEKKFHSFLLLDFGRGPPSDIS